jgi:hypothetical protein
MPIPGPALELNDIQNQSSVNPPNPAPPFAHAIQFTTVALPASDNVKASQAKDFTENPRLLSRANYKGLQKSFPGSPINGSPLHESTLTPEEIRIKFVNLVLRGPVADETPAGEYTAVAGYDFSSFDRDYWKNGAPSYEAINKQLQAEFKAGDPGNAFMPNIKSVPRGDISGYAVLARDGAPSSKIAKMTQPQYGGSAFIGGGTSLSPLDSSLGICARTELLLGKSNIALDGALTPTTE